jgi:hypothetical protein
MAAPMIRRVIESSLSFSSMLGALCVLGGETYGYSRCNILANGIVSRT